MLLIFILCFVPFVTARHDHEKIWENYTNSFSKSYENFEQEATAKAFLKKCFEDNEAHNKAYEKGEITFIVGLNNFSDGDLTALSNQLLHTLHPFPARDSPLPKPESFPAGPPTLDWSPYLQPIVNQGSCGSCWAFSTVAQLESLYLRNSSNYNYKFSPQFLMDCNRAPPNNGCFGGWPTIAMIFIVLNGILDGSSYCYTGAQALTCKTPAPEFVTPKIGKKSIQYNLFGNEEYLKNILAVEGPLVVTIWASPLFMKSKAGVFSDNLLNCRPGCVFVNHAVLLIGYGTDVATGNNYWLLRNSWGTHWGEAGNFRMLRDGSNNCNTACYAMFIRNS